MSIDLNVPEHIWYHMSSVDTTSGQLLCEQWWCCNRSPISYTIMKVIPKIFFLFWKRRLETRQWIASGKMVWCVNCTECQGCVSFYLDSGNAASIVCNSVGKVLPGHSGIDNSSCSGPIRPAVHRAEGWWVGSNRMTLPFSTHPYLKAAVLLYIQ